MQPLPSDAQSVLVNDTSEAPQRWRAALDKMQQLLADLDRLDKILEGALYLDDSSWQAELPVQKFTMTLQVQHQRVNELEKRLADLRARLAASEQGRAAAEDRVKELGEELENNARVFKLHFEELLRKDREIAELQAMVSSISLGRRPGSSAGGSSRFGGGGGADSDADEGGTELKGL
ncbi:hypothetical protein N2152v2_002352 [Parachlorella kessleri]